MDVRLSLFIHLVSVWHKLCLEIIVLFASQPILSFPTLSIPNDNIDSYAKLFWIIINYSWIQFKPV